MDNRKFAGSTAFFAPGVVPNPEAYCESPRGTTSMCMGSFEYVYMLRGIYLTYCGCAPVSPDSYVVARNCMAPLVAPRVGPFCLSVPASLSPLSAPLALAERGYLQVSLL